MINEHKTSMNCRKCGATVSKNGYLFSCQNNLCRIAFWDTNVTLQNLDDVGVLDQVLTKSGVPRGNEVSYSAHRKDHYTVYVIYLNNDLGDFDHYVGMTGLHPYERYLNHLRGYKANEMVKKYGYYMLKFEGPMSYQFAQKREKSILAEIPGTPYSR